MAGTPRSKQINFDIGDKLAVAVQLIAQARNVSVPDIMRELVSGYVDQELKADDDLRIAVEAMLRSIEARAPKAGGVTSLEGPRSRRIPSSGTTGS